MKTFILPGFSIKNKDWAYQTKESLELKTQTEVIEWEHWRTGDTNFANWSEWLEKETPRVLNKIGGEPVNVLAKSIGTLLAMNVLKIKPSVVNKIFLNGIPLSDIEDKDKLAYEILKEIPEGKIMLIQNKNDNHGSFSDVSNFLKNINSGIKVVSKPRNDHEYPYFDDFREFLK